MSTRSESAVTVPDKLLKKMENHVTRVIFCGPHYPFSHEYSIELLRPYPYVKVDVVPLEKVAKVIPEYHLCIVKSMKLDADIISRAEKMKLILQFGVGLEGVDIEAATRHGIKVARIPSDVTGNASSTAEMAIYLMLGLLRRQAELQISVQNRLVGVPTGDTLLGKTVFIMGFGTIGMHLAKRLKAFDVRIIATKRSWSSQGENDLVDEKGSHADIIHFASKADIVVCCLSLNRDTLGIIDGPFMGSMRKGAYLVNIARGGLIDYEAAVEHMRCGHLGGLGLDVTWTEPFDPHDPIFEFQNVLITPHVAGVTEHSYRSMAKVVADVALQLHCEQSLTGIEVVN